MKMCSVPESCFPRERRSFTYTAREKEQVWEVAKQFSFLHSLITSAWPHNQLSNILRSYPFFIPDCPETHRGGVAHSCWWSHGSARRSTAQRPESTYDWSWCSAFDPVGPHESLNCASVMEKWLWKKNNITNEGKIQWSTGIMCCLCSMHLLFDPNRKPGSSLHLLGSEVLYVDASSESFWKTPLSYGRKMYHFMKLTNKFCILLINTLAKHARRSHLATDQKAQEITHLCAKYGVSGFSLVS